MPKVYNQTISSLYKKYKGPSPGEIGLEIECEGWNLPVEMLGFWSVHSDGSLKPPSGPGGGCLEYVLREPLPRDTLQKALSYLAAKFAEYTTKLRDSYRCSTHVHLDCLSLSMREVYNIIILYMVFEDALVRFSGPDRQGNLFCLRSSDAEDIVLTLRKAVKNDDYGALTPVELRYGGLNVQSLYKFGSLEFRTMRGPVSNSGKFDVELVQVWVDMLLRLKDMALKFDNPQQIVQEVSYRSPLKLLRDTFKANSKLLESQYSTVSSLEAACYEGVRLAQDIAYATEWVKEAPAPLKATRKLVTNELLSTPGAPIVSWGLEDHGTISLTINSSADF